MLAENGWLNTKFRFLLSIYQTKVQTLMEKGQTKFGLAGEKGSNYKFWTLWI